MLSSFYFSASFKKGRYSVPLSTIFLTLTFIWLMYAISLVAINGGEDDDENTTSEYSSSSSSLSCFGGGGVIVGAMAALPAPVPSTFNFTTQNFTIYNAYWGFWTEYSIVSSIAPHKHSFGEGLFLCTNRLEPNSGWAMGDFYNSTGWNTMISLVASGDLWLGFHNLPLGSPNFTVAHGRRANAVNSIGNSVQAGYYLVWGTGEPNNWAGGEYLAAVTRGWSPPAINDAPNWLTCQHTVCMRSPCENHLDCAPWKNNNNNNNNGNNNMSTFEKEEQLGRMLPAQGFYPHCTCRCRLGPFRGNATSYRPCRSATASISFISISDSRTMTATTTTTDSEVATVTATRGGTASTTSTKSVYSSSSFTPSVSLSFLSSSRISTSFTQQQSSSTSLSPTSSSFSSSSLSSSFALIRTTTAGSRRNTIHNSILSNLSSRRSPTRSLSTATLTTTVGVNASRFTINNLSTPSRTRTMPYVPPTIPPETLPVGVPPPPCPSTTLRFEQKMDAPRNSTSSSAATTVPIEATAVTDGLIRAGALVVVVRLETPNVSFVAPLVRFAAAGGGAAADPRSLPAIVDLSAVDCALGGMEVSFGGLSSVVSTVRCRLPVSPQYALSSAERLAVVVVGAATTRPCGRETWPAGTFVVSPANEPTLVAATRAVTTAATSVAVSVVVLLAEGSPVEVQLMALLLQSPCATAADRESVAVVRYFVSPFYAGTSTRESPDTRTLTTVVAGNTILMIAFSALHATMTAMVAWRAHIPRLRAAARTRFPGLSLLVSQLLYAGVVFGTAALAFAQTAEDTSSGATIGVVLVGALVAVAVPVLHIFVLRRTRHLYYDPYDWHAEATAPGNTTTAGKSSETSIKPSASGRRMWRVREDFDGDFSDRRVRVGLLEPQTPVVFPRQKCNAPTSRPSPSSFALAFLPDGRWGPRASARRLTGVLGGFRCRDEWWVLLPFALSAVTALLVALLPAVAAADCQNVFVAAAMLAVVTATLVALLRPHRTPVAALLTVACLALLALVAAAQVAAIRSPQPWALQFKAASVLLLVTCVMARTACAAFAAMCERLAKNFLKWENKWWFYYYRFENHTDTFEGGKFGSSSAEVTESETGERHRFDKNRLEGEDALANTVQQEQQSREEDVEKGEEEKVAPEMNEEKRKDDVDNTNNDDKECDGHASLHRDKKEHHSPTTTTTTLTTGSGGDEEGQEQEQGVVVKSPPLLVATSTTTPSITTTTTIIIVDHCNSPPSSASPSPSSISNGTEKKQKKQEETTAINNIDPLDIDMNRFPSSAFMLGFPSILRSGSGMDERQGAEDNKQQQASTVKDDDDDDDEIDEIAGGSGKGAEHGRRRKEELQKIKDDYTSRTCFDSYENANYNKSKAKNGTGRSTKVSFFTNSTNDNNNNNNKSNICSSPPPTAACHRRTSPPSSLLLYQLSWGQKLALMLVPSSLLLFRQGGGGGKGNCSYTSSSSSPSSYLETLLSFFRSPTPVSSFSGKKSSSKNNRINDDHTTNSSCDSSSSSSLCEDSEDVLDRRVHHPLRHRNSSGDAIHRRRRHAAKHRLGENISIKKEAIFVNTNKTAAAIAAKRGGNQHHHNCYLYHQSNQISSTNIQWSCSEGPLELDDTDTDSISTGMCHDTVSLNIDDHDDDLQQRRRGHQQRKTKNNNNNDRNGDDGGSSSCLPSTVSPTSPPSFAAVSPLGISFNAANQRELLSQQQLRESPHHHRHSHQRRRLSGSSRSPSTHHHHHPLNIMRHSSSSAAGFGRISSIDSSSICASGSNLSPTAATTHRHHHTIQVVTPVKSGGGGGGVVVCVGHGGGEEEGESGGAGMNSHTTTTTATVAIFSRRTPAQKKMLEQQHPQYHQHHHHHSPHSPPLSQQSPSLATSPQHHLDSASDRHRHHNHNHRKHPSLESGEEEECSASPPSSSFSLYHHPRRSLIFGSGVSISRCDDDRERGGRNTQDDAVEAFTPVFSPLAHPLPLTNHINKNINHHNNSSSFDGQKRIEQREQLSRRCLSHQLSHLGAASTVSTSSEDSGE